MNTKYAFVDEFGAFGFKFESEDCSTHFIITSIIVDEENLKEVENGVEEIKNKYFPQSEIKSSRIGKNHNKRTEILNQLKNLPFNIFSVVVDKRKIYEQSGLRYKSTFYKFLNNILYQELRSCFRCLVITADEIGGNDYLKSFANYVREHEIPVSLFDDSLFRFDNSKNNVIIQVADLVSGSLAYNFDIHKKEKSQGYNYAKLLDSKILMIKEYPVSKENFEIPTLIDNPNYNAQIAEICYRKAQYFIKSKEKTEDLETKQQIAVLEYLLFRFMNRSPRKYIPTKELMNHLCHLGYEKMSLQHFRNKIIARLRDKEVVISSSRDGYKIPASENELIDFINHGKTIIVPMLDRLKKCHDIIKMGTDGTIDLFEKTEFCKLFAGFPKVDQEEDDKNQ